MISKHEFAARAEVETAGRGGRSATRFGIAAVLDYYDGRGHGEDTSESDLEWGGEGARYAGLTGTVEREDLIKALGGLVYNPETGLEQQLGRVQRDLDGELKLEHRIGLDLTFTPPKSFSIAWGVGGDERIADNVHVPAMR